MSNRLYKKSYGAWAGNPRGVAPDYSRCCEEVWPNQIAAQCGWKRGYGPDKAYCKQHDPAAVAEKRARQDAAYAAKFNKDRISWNGATFLKALREIAAGHNDALARSPSR